MSTTVQQQITFTASPAQLYAALMDTTQHAAFTGSAAQISPEVGGAFRCFEGQIEGRNVELVPNARIVQAWRVAAWPAGVYSVVRMDLTEHDGGAQLQLTHTGLPEGAAELVGPGWHARYWEPLAAFFK